MSRHYDVIVIGAGSMGMAAGFFLARQGLRVLLIDQYDPPHTNASHHGDTRIIRHAYSAGREYVPLVLRAQQLWNELAEESGREIFCKTGVLRVGKKGSDFIEKQLEIARDFSLPLDVMSKREMEARWGGLVIPQGYTGCFEENSGILFCEGAIRAYRELALKSGARLLVHTRVSAIHYQNECVKVETEKENFEADQLVITAGAWAKELCGELDLPLQPLHKSLVWIEADESLYSYQHFPAFVFDTPDGQYYGMPDLCSSGIKIGRNDGGEPINPDDLTAVPPNVDDLLLFSHMYFSHVSNSIKNMKSCLYNVTPDEHFIIDQHPQHANVWIATGFSGHGFKFASAIGEVVSQLVTGGTASYDLSRFSLSRFRYSS